jgi:hypothetical protein
MFFWVIRFIINSMGGYSLDLYSIITTNAMYDAILIMLWTYSAITQTSSDLSDPIHISTKPWYLERGCGMALPENKGACEVMKISYGLSVFAA